MLSLIEQSCEYCVLKTTMHNQLSQLECYRLCHLTNLLSIYIFGDIYFSKKTTLTLIFRIQPRNGKFCLSSGDLFDNNHG